MTRAFVESSVSRNSDRLFSPVSRSDEHRSILRIHKNEGRAVEPGVGNENEAF